MHRAIVRILGLFCALIVGAVVSASSSHAAIVRCWLATPYGQPAANRVLSYGPFAEYEISASPTGDQIAPKLGHALALIGVVKGRVQVKGSGPPGSVNVPGNNPVTGGQCAWVEITGSDILLEAQQVNGEDVNAIVRVYIQELSQ